MKLNETIARHLREVYFGGNSTGSNLKAQLSDINWKQAITRVKSFNTILALVYHMNYYVRAALEVLRGEGLNASDKFSFDHPEIQSQKEWESFLENTWTEVESLAALIEQFPESKLWDDFADSKYGTYYRNFHGIIEHCHYHLGQIALIKKMLTESE